MSADPTAALQVALAAEHAVIWGYGVVGAGVADDVQPAVQVSEQAHRARRDDTEALLRSRSAEPVRAAASYELPFPVTDPASALRLAAALEDGCAAAWHYVLAQTDGQPLRGTALAALTGCALQGVRWRLAAGLQPATLAFPGQ